MPATNAGDLGFSFVNLILVRHGQSEGNVFPWQGPLGGQDPALTAAGRGQANATAQCFTGDWVFGEKGSCTRPDLVFSSRLLRAMETALLAFPRKGVHLAPHVMEREKGAKWLHPGSTPRPRDKQLARVREDLGDESVERLSFDWLPDPQMEVFRLSDWGQFLVWLWGLPEVQRLLAVGSEADAAVSGRARPCIALVSHGNFLGDLLSPLGWRAHPKNAMAMLTRLSIDPDGFGPLSVTSVLCEGEGGWAKSIWTCVALLALLSVALCVAYNLRGRMSGKRDRPAADSDAIELRDSGRGRS